MAGHSNDGPGYTASIRAYSCRGTTVQLPYELSQGQVVPYLSPHVPVTVSPTRPAHAFWARIPAAGPCARGVLLRTCYSGRQVR
jgi:hypothetical protein